jgi:isopenicillin-N N-acyltransferase-like protein
MTEARRIRVLRLSGTPRERGLAHGRAFGESIRRYTEERVRLAADGSWAGRPVTRADVLALAEEMLPAHRAYAPDLYEEMVAMAEAAEISAAEAVIVGGFTDFVDAVRARSQAPATPAQSDPALEAELDDCTAILTRSILAQTWDMHDSATEHVVMLDVDDVVPSWVFTTVGCVAQIGMNAAGIAVGINNLAATDGRVGVTWPFVVRKVLQATTLEGARDAITQAPLAGGHNYLVLDAHGQGFNVEAMPTHAAFESLAAHPLVHANHCVVPEARAREAARSPSLLESSHARHARAVELSAGPLDAEALMAFTRDPTICRRSEAPYHVESSGAVVMSPGTRELWAVWGIPVDHAFERFTFTAGKSPP